MPEREVETLLQPFSQGLVPVPGPGRAFLLRAEVSPSLDQTWRRALVCEQTFRPAFERLAASGFAVERRLQGRYDAALCVLTKHKTENLINIARAWELLVPGGALACAGANDTGARSVERRIRDLAGIRGTLSKNHCRVFWTHRTAETPAAFAEWLELGRLRPNVEGQYLTCPGMFSWDKVDAGSRLLVDTIPAGIAGDVADLGAGWGYISSCLLARCPDVRTLDLYEADLLALDAARANLSTVANSHRAAFHWHDVARGLPEGRRYDWIVMNPPFHAGKETDIGLGRAFIAAAARALRPSGALMLVANRPLPYEAELKAAFSAAHIVVQSQGFKVMLARR